MKKCPFCAEQVQDEAVKCKHCGSAFKKMYFDVYYLSSGGKYKHSNQLSGFSKEAVIESLEKQGCKVGAIWSKKFPKEILDEQINKHCQNAVSKKRSIIIILVILGFILILVGDNVQRKRITDGYPDYCRQIHPTKVDVCVDCLNRNGGPANLGACVSAFSENNYSEHEKQLYADIQKATLGISEKRRYL